MRLERRLYATQARLLNEMKTDQDDYDIVKELDEMKKDPKK